MFLEKLAFFFLDDMSDSVLNYRINVSLEKNDFKDWFLLDLERNKVQRELWKEHQHSIRQRLQKTLK